MVQEQYPKGKHVQSKQGNGEVGCGNPVHSWLAAAGGMKRSAAVIEVSLQPGIAMRTCSPGRTRAEARRLL